MYCGKCRRHGKTIEVLVFKRDTPYGDKTITFCPECCPDVKKRIAVDGQNIWKQIRYTGRC